MSSIWCLLGSIVFMSPNEAPQDEAAPNILHQRYRLDSALFFAFMIVWFGWQGGGLIGSLIWASAVSCVRKVIIIIGHRNCAPVSIKSMKQSATSRRTLGRSTPPSVSSLSLSLVTMTHEYDPSRHGRVGAHHHQYPLSLPSL